METKVPAASCAQERTTLACEICKWHHCCTNQATKTICSPNQTSPHHGCDSRGANKPTNATGPMVVVTTEHKIATIHNNATAGDIDIQPSGTLMNCRPVAIKITQRLSNEQHQLTRYHDSHYSGGSNSTR